ncbi:predicted protein [Streptomyces iranensis]|uniref:Uncharacterized protein n=1 Tax=Streptomyces iranensis TaxID=576784 RepID=A0A061A3T6_9ACTN|nr:predicted protein [Streptomyces iranensis]
MVAVTVIGSFWSYWLF